MLSIFFLYDVFTFINEMTCFDIDASLRIKLKY